MAKVKLTLLCLIMTGCLGSGLQGVSAQSLNISDLNAIIDASGIIFDLFNGFRQTEAQQQPLSLEERLFPTGRKSLRDEDAPGQYWIFQGHALIAIPLGTFGDNMREEGYGFGGEILTNISGPVYAGVHFTGARFDNYSIEYTEVFDGDIYEYDELTASRMLLSHVAVRFDPELEGMFKPYVQGLIGAHWYYTNTRIKDLGADEVVDRFKESTDVVFGFGAVAGLQIIPPKWRNFGFDLRAGYFTNGSVTYMRYDPSLSGPNGYPVESFEEKTSAVQMLGIQLGVVLRY